MLQLSNKGINKPHICESALKLRYRAMHGHDDDVCQAEVGIRCMPCGQLHQQDAERPNVSCLVVPAASVCACWQTLGGSRRIVCEDRQMLVCLFLSLAVLGFQSRLLVQELTACLPVLQQHDGQSRRQGKLL